MIGAAILHVRRAAYPQAVGDALVLVFVAAVGLSIIAEAKHDRALLQGARAWALQFTTKTTI